MKKLINLHPLLIALVPISVLLSKNVQVVGLSDVMLPALAALLLAGILLAAFWLARHDFARSAILASVVLVPFLFYGKLFYFLWARDIGPRGMNHLHMVLVPGLLCAVGCLSLFVWRTSKDLQSITIFLTVSSTAIILLSSGQTLISMARNHGAPSKELTKAHDITPHPTILADSPQWPDVYDIVLDGYARADTLMNRGLDNSPFLDALRKRGFYVADQAMTNYTCTHMSLSSTLNMRYLDEESRSWTEKQYYGLIQDSEVVRKFKRMGYRYVHFATPWMGTRSSPLADITCEIRPWLYRDEFASSYLRTTVLCMIEPTVAKAFLLGFDKLREVPSIQGPTFTFSHMLVTHGPFVFDRDGNVRADIPLCLTWKADKYRPERGRDPYIENLQFVNQKILKAIDEIIKQSPARPIIFLHSDHGVWTKGTLLNTDGSRTGILFAIYAPEACLKNLYPSITPVNAYRTVFRTCFGEDLHNLPDRSYVYLPETVTGPWNLDSVIQGEPRERAGHQTTLKQ